MIKRGDEMKLSEIDTDALPDIPALTFVYQEVDGVIQQCHIRAEQLLSVPGMGDTRWRYMYETHEMVPVFKYVGDPDILPTVLDLELYRGPLDYDRKSWWATPKGFPRSPN